ncbi:TetR/AcrR family transcriptional regulator C-terminal domain-containing protein [Schaalia suimastitidis]|uniref:TetR/AcrR family transcriptional regulator C-terminal domain-containing protein n=1 Tax=Schaalia suimastitidis TaxID=121163 RepID=UPI00040C3E37|nr:TetR/AcrR family transcriptional regulator C-terminal domain-containing protein [Schaalia suimastitidis]
MKTCDDALNSPTRQALASALKTALRTTPLNKVTVRQLTDAAGLRRQTFYYHFADVYDLAVWLFKSEIADHILSHASYAQWSDGFLEMLVYLQQHREQSFAVISSLKHDDLELFFYQQLRTMTAAIVAELDGDLPVKKDDREFIVQHYTLCVLGHLLHWLAREMRDDPYILVENIERILHGSVLRSLELFAAPQAR